MTYKPAHIGNEEHLHFAVCTAAGCDWYLDLSEQWVNRPREIPNFCPQCGERVIVRCQKCETPVGEPADTYCRKCGDRLKGPPLAKLG